MSPVRIPGAKEVVAKEVVAKEVAKVPGKEKARGRAKGPRTGKLGLLKRR